jgi:hypothetical protein
MRTASFSLRIIAALLAVVSAFFAVGATQAQEKSYRYDRIDVTVDVRPDGTLDVAETMTLNYTGGPFHGVGREIALQRIDRVYDISVSDDNGAYTAAQSGETPGTYVVEQTTGAATVRWFFEPLSNTTRTFTLRYQVDGAVRVGNTTDEIWWIGVFPDRTVPVQQSSVTVNLPNGAQLRSNDVLLPAATGTLSINANSVSVSRDEPLPGGQALEIQVRFPSALIDSPMPAWQSALVSQPAYPAPVAPVSQPAYPAPVAQGAQLAYPAAPFTTTIPSTAPNRLNGLFCPLLLVILICVLLYIMWSAGSGRRRHGYRRSGYSGATSGVYHQYHGNSSGSYDSDWNSSSSSGDWGGSSDSGGGWGGGGGDSGGGGGGDGGSGGGGGGSW